VRSWNNLLAITAALSLCIVVGVVSLTSCSAPPKVAVGYVGHITGVQLGEYVLVPNTPSFSESGYILFYYEGQLDDSWVIQLDSNKPDSYIPLNGAFTQSLGGDMIEVYNLKLDADGRLSCDWKRLK